MRSCPLKIPFFLALLFACFGTALLPELHLAPFAPFLALCYYRVSFSRAIWLSFFSGLILDLLTAQPRFGLYALCYCMATVVIYHQKRHFFEDKPLAICLFTAVISSAVTLAEIVLLYAFDAEPILTPLSLATDLIGMPLIDGIYAFIWFFCPIRGYIKVRKQISLYRTRF